MQSLLIALVGFAATAQAADRLLESNTFQFVLQNPDVGGIMTTMEAEKHMKGRGTMNTNRGSFCEDNICSGLQNLFAEQHAEGPGVEGIEGCVNFCRDAAAAENKKGYVAMLVESEFPGCFCTEGCDLLVSTENADSSYPPIFLELEGVNKRCTDIKTITADQFYAAV